MFDNLIIELVVITSFLLLITILFLLYIFALLLTMIILSNSFDTFKELSKLQYIVSPFIVTFFVLDGVMLSFSSVFVVSQILFSS